MPCRIIIVVQVGPLWRVALVLGLTGDLGTKAIVGRSNVRCGGSSKRLCSFFFSGGHACVRACMRFGLVWRLYWQRPRYKVSCVLCLCLYLRVLCLLCLVFVCVYVRLLCLLRLSFLSCVFGVGLIFCCHCLRNLWVAVLTAAAAAASASAGVVTTRRKRKRRPLSRPTWPWRERSSPWDWRGCGISSQCSTAGR